MRLLIAILCLVLTPSSQAEITLNVDLSDGSMSLAGNGEFVDLLSIESVGGNLKPTGFSSDRGQPFVTLVDSDTGFLAKVRGDGIISIENPIPILARFDVLGERDLVFASSGGGKLVYVPEPASGNVLILALWFCLLGNRPTRSTNQSNLTTEGTPTGARS